MPIESLVSLVIANIKFISACIISSSHMRDSGTMKSLNLEIYGIFVFLTYEGELFYSFTINGL